MRRVSVSRAALHRAGLRRVALPAAGWPGGARRGASGGGGDDNPYFPAGMPQELKDSIVLWYDLERQGATNESMAENPTLKDLSGNGNDATCYNFGWSGMSGIGGYPDRTDMTRYWATYRIKNGFITKTSIHITSIKAQTPELINNNYIIYWFPFGSNPLTGEYTNDEITLKIHNPNHIELKYRWLMDTSTPFNSDLTLTIPSREWNVNNKQIAFGIFQTDTSVDVEDADITVELQPTYKGAIVSDGVDDYAFVQDKYDDEGNLINKKSLVLNKEDGYTVIAKREIINPEKHKDGSLISDRTYYGDGAFSIESFQENNSCHSINWDHDNPINYETSNLVYQKSKSYCGQSLISGPANISIKIYNGRFSFWGLCSIFSYTL